MGQFPVLLPELLSFHHTKGLAQGSIIPIRIQSAARASCFMGGRFREPALEIAPDAGEGSLP